MVRSTLWFGASSACALWLVQGCGGTTLTHDDRGPDGSYGGSSHGGPGFFGTGGTSRYATCGNGVVDPGEDCDGTDLSGRTCLSLSFGQATGGTLKCTPKCTFDTTGCTHLTGAGGAFVGAGGFVGTGGFRGGGAGYGGLPISFVEGGVPIVQCGPGSAPDPTNPGACTPYEGGVPACETWVNSALPRAPRGGSMCGTTCGCLACPTELSNCLADPACAAIERCTLANGCYDNVMCQGICGNPSGASFSKALMFDKCWESAGCNMFCSVDGGTAAAP